MKKHALKLLFTTLLIVTSSISFADEQESYGSKVGDKALNGFANMTTSILEIPKNIINTSNESYVLWGLTGGTAKGILNMAGRLATGLTDFITAPLPTETFIYPKYVWDDFDENTTYGEVFRLQE